MSSRDQDFATLLRRAREGCQDAARDLVERFDRPVRRHVRLRMPALLRPKLDSADLAQLAWMRFFERFLPIREFETPAHLLAFVFGLARNEALAAGHKFLDRGKRDVRRERSLSDSLALGAEPATGLPDDPALVAMQRDEWESLLARLPQGERTILELLREGYACGEVALRLGVCDRTVRRALQRAQQQKRDRRVG